MLSHLTLDPHRKTTSVQCQFFSWVAGDADESQRVTQAVHPPPANCGAVPAKKCDGTRQKERSRQ